MKQIVMKLCLLLSGLLLAGQYTFAQDSKSVSGLVVDKETNQPISGVSVVQTGTKNGVTTDANGKFVIKLKGNASLSFSIVGYAAQKVAYTGQESLNVSMDGEASNLGEVVVTALGIKKDKRDLAYSTQTVDTKELTKARETNIANSLSGKVAGLDVTRSAAGVSSSSRIVLRGERSLTGNSQALIVVDGVPINNNYYSFTQSSPGNANGGRDVGDGISSINPDDIESINVLKGASAAALYGSRASNGAIIINTQKGNNKKGLGVNINSSTQIEQAMMLRDFQQVYGQGINGEYNPKSESSWGSKLDGQQVATWSVAPADAGKTYAYSAHPNNYKDFYNLGVNLTNSVAINSGGEHTNGYFSYTNTNAKGIIDNNTLKRHNLNLRVGGDLGSKITFDTKLTYLNQVVKNSIRTGETFDNINRQIIRMPTNISLTDAQNYSYLVESGADAGKTRQNYWNPGSNGGQNPYWIKNNTPTVDERNRLLGFVAFNYKILPELNFMVRSGFDKLMDTYDLRWHNDTYILAQAGNLQVGNNNVTETNNDFLFTYNKELSKDFTIAANLGGNIQHDKVSGYSTNNSALVYENLFSTSNATASSTVPIFTEFEKQSLYASTDIGFKKYLILALTGRRDVSSTLPVNNRAYNFGSAGLTAVVSDMVKMPAFISFAKVRASLASTGNEANPYSLDQVYNFATGGNGIIVNRSGTLAIPNLKPEQTISQEVGLDMNFFNNRLGFEFTMYNSNTSNQLFNVSLTPTSGFDSKYINSGDVNNKGLEVVIHATPVVSKDFKWTTNINYSMNRNKVLSIYGGLDSYVATSDFMNVVKAVVGRPFGELYSRGLLRNASGQVEVDPQTGIPLVTAGSTVYVGNTRPKWLGGWGNTFSYKSFSLSVLLSARIGGIVSSFTNSVINADGLTTETLAGRDGFVYDGVNPDGTKNTKSITAQQYWQAVGGRNTPVGELFAYSASNIRLRELVFSYSLPEKLIENTPFKGVSFSLTGRNLFFIMNKAKGFDPESVVGNTSTSVGLESFSLPSTRSFGFNVRLNF